MRTVARRLATVATLAALGGCGAIPLAIAEASPPASSGTGTATLTLTGPYRTTTVPGVNVTCAVGGGQYTLYAVVVRPRRQLAVSMNVPGYAGPGTYTSSVRVVAHGPHGGHWRKFRVPVTITSGGGSATVTRTLPGIVYPALGGKTVTLSAVWTCAA